MTSSSSLIRRRAKAVGIVASSTLASAAALSGGSLLAVAPAGAQAPGSCSAHSAFLDRDGGSFQYEAGNHSKVGAAGCPHIYAQSETCVSSRVRFYPSSGGSYVNAWRQVCGGLQSYTVATNVAGGTKYRSEIDQPSGDWWLAVWD